MSKALVLGVVVDDEEVVLIQQDTNVPMGKDFYNNSLFFSWRSSLLFSCGRRYFVAVACPQEEFYQVRLMTYHSKLSASPRQPLLYVFNRA